MARLPAMAAPLRALLALVLLCFAATSTATLWHYLLGLEAPYPWYDLPVVLGTLGGIGELAKDALGSVKQDAAPAKPKAPRDAAASVPRIGGAQDGA